MLGKFEGQASIKFCNYPLKLCNVYITCERITKRHTEAAYSACVIENQLVQMMQHAMPIF